MADTVRVLLHSGAALVWIGVYGFSLADSPSRQWRVAAWGAFAVLVVTGMWSLVAADVTTVSPAVQVLVLLKIVLAICSAAAGAVAMLASRERVRSAMAVSTVVLAAAAGITGFVIASAV